MTAQVVYGGTDEPIPAERLEPAVVAEGGKAEARLERLLSVSGLRPSAHGQLWERVEASGIEQGYWPDPEFEGPDWVRHEDPDLWRKHRIEDEP